MKKVHKEKRKKKEQKKKKLCLENCEQKTKVLSTVQPHQNINLQLPDKESSILKAHIQNFNLLIREGSASFVLL